MSTSENDIKAIIDMFCVKNEGVKLLKESNFLESIGNLSDSKKSELAKILEFLPPPVETNEFCIWVSKVRKQIDWTQKELGGKVDLKKDRICKLESKKPNVTDEKKDEIKNLLVNELKVRSLL